MTNDFLKKSKIKGTSDCNSELIVFKHLLS